MKAVLLLTLLGVGDVLAHLGNHTMKESNTREARSLFILNNHHISPRLIEHNKNKDNHSKEPSIEKESKGFLSSTWQYIGSLVDSVIGINDDMEDNLVDEVDKSLSFPTCSKESGVCRAKPHASVVSCGETTRSAYGRIINGENALPGQNPWVVGVQYVSKIYCAGALITNKYVITAAHCFYKINYSMVKLVIGDHDRSHFSKHQTTRRISHIHLHKEFDQDTFNNDIALLRMNKPVVFSDHIRPVCLPTTVRAYDGENATIVGWGKLALNGNTADVLQSALVPLIPRTICKENRSYQSSEITENMMCAEVDESHVDACQGDSGAPMVWQNKKMFTQIGIVSWGQGCATEGYPGVYTDVGKYLEWILKNTKDSCYCLEESTTEQ